MYLNGTQNNGATNNFNFAGTATGNFTGATWRLANNAQWPNFSNVILDEVRVSNTVRSAGWIRTEYNNQNAPASFYSVGPEQKLRQGLLKELYMTETIGLDIGSHSIKLVGLKMTSKGPFLTCLGMKEIPRRKDEGNIDSLIDTLRTLLKEVPLKTKKVRVTVSGRGVNLIRLTLPSMPRVEM